MALLLAWTAAFLWAQEDPISVETLIEHLRANASQRQLEVMEQFARQTDAPKSIPTLLKLLKDEAPAMDNNVCLALEQVLAQHPDADCPLDPLLETIGRRVWTSQQKGAQALCQAMKEKNVKGREEELCRRLIPLLTSQRPRVFNAALRCLKKLTGQNLGPDADAWRKHYEKRFAGKKLDLSAAVYELVVVVRPLGKKPPMEYEVNGEKVAGREKLTARLAELQERAGRDKLVLGAVIQISDAEMQRMSESMDLSLVQEAMECVQAVVPEVTVAPQSDGFRSPYGGAPK